MSIWNEANAIVTGAASGIGLALSEAMIARGVNVWLTDVNATEVEKAAEKLGPKAHWSELDVRDSSAVLKVTEAVAAEQGHLDFFFNNAGIGIGGEMHTLSNEHFDRIIDVNIRGVMNGVAAAYPIMVKQKRGHLINTASAAGLIPAPLLTPYSMTKHAVVGLSTSLRLEAENYGVKVSVLCPSAIETPLLDTKGPEDLERTWIPNLRRYLTKLGGPPFPVNKFADYALNKIESNRGLIIAPSSGRISTTLYRLAPGMVLRKIQQALNAELEERPSAPE